MNRSYYGKQSKYSGQRQDPYADPSDSYEQPQSFYSSRPGTLFDNLMDFY